MKRKKISKLKEEWIKKEEEYIAKLKGLQTDLDNAMKKEEEYITKLRYLQADFDNAMKRWEKERNEIVKNANVSLILSLLPIIDSFDSAIKNASNDSTASGIEMIYIELLKVLEKEGFTCMKSVGEKFDPYKHEAVSLLESDNIEDNTIIEEVRKGYLLNDKVLRTAKVIVGKKKQELDSGKDEERLL